ncbi:tRNA pseudouridine synthase A [Nitritalea halalkaliphila LW7]|uniref:tRNA pseudouridine synthase n=1 Tax=Nitritalea halalkaliphila LW7 TaxID=1189621 RepID=I5CA64_9BACT|nr:tRNA pseudouridine synthase A [Nitritalea halalkaliphila]EIM78716.1 tRNA pseudouridine synthase A [Nitritalea halalkaliphila LW7]
MHLAYDGSPYHGWQTQPNAHTVQQEIEEALARILRRPCPIMGSGRTDTGVHALEQVAHFDMEEEVEEALLRKKLNGILPPAIAIHAIREVQADAHARFDALDRSYRYELRLRKDPFAPGAPGRFIKCLRWKK